MVLHRLLLLLRNRLLLHLLQRHHLGHIRDLTIRRQHWHIHHLLLLLLLLLRLLRLLLRLLLPYCTGVLAQRHLWRLCSR